MFAAESVAAVDPSPRLRSMVDLGAPHDLFMPPGNGHSECKDCVMQAHYAEPLCVLPDAVLVASRQSGCRWLVVQFSCGAVGAVVWIPANASVPFRAPW